jgi:hypothetical protein
LEKGEKTMGETTSPNSSKEKMAMPMYIEKFGKRNEERQTT